MKMVESKELIDKFGVMLKEYGTDVIAISDEYETKIADSNNTKIINITTNLKDEAIFVYILNIYDREFTIKLTNTNIVYLEDGELIEYECEDCGAPCSEYDEFVNGGERLVCQECRMEYDESEYKLYIDFRENDIKEWIAQDRSWEDIVKQTAHELWEDSTIGEIESYILSENFLDFDIELVSIIKEVIKDTNLYQYNDTSDAGYDKIYTYIYCLDTIISKEMLEELKEKIEEEIDIDSMYVECM